jgi:hypothetical protein
MHSCSIHSSANIALDVKDVGGDRKASVAQTNSLFNSDRQLIWSTNMADFGPFMLYRVVGYLFVCVARLVEYVQRLIAHFFTAFVVNEPPLLAVPGAITFTVRNASDMNNIVLRGKGLILC